MCAVCVSPMELGGDLVLVRTFRAIVWRIVFNESIISATMTELRQLFQKCLYILELRSVETRLRNTSVHAANIM